MPIVRRHGLVGSPHDLGLNGHACWGFNDAAEFHAAAGPFLTEGLRLGQRLMFVGGPEAEDVVRGTDPMREMVRDGSLQIAPFESVYPGGRRMAHADQLAMYAGATEQALVDGFTGLRVLAEVTALVTPAEEWPDQVGWEGYADRYMANQPLAALCCFDRRLLPDEAISALGSAHPVASSALESLVPFQIHAAPDAMMLTGEVDALSSIQLGRLLELTMFDEGEVVLDLEDLRFIDHTGVLVLNKHVRRFEERGARLTLRGESGMFRRLSDLLEPEA